MARVREGYGFYGPRSSKNARLLIEAAEKVGLEGNVVATTNGGYIVPNEVLDQVHGKAEAEPEGKEEVPEVAVLNAVEETNSSKRPGKNDPKSDWESYVKSLGVEIPEGATKDDLFALADEAEEEKN